MNEETFHSSEKKVLKPPPTKEDSDLVESEESSAKTIEIPSSASGISPILDPISSNDFSARTEGGASMGTSSFIHSTPTLADIPQQTSKSDLDSFKETMSAENAQESALTQNENWKFSSGSSRGDILGTTLDVCRLESKLGQGGMGTVYMAHHMTLQKKVAIKILPPELAMNQKILDRFFREAQSAAKLEHPNIVQVHDVRSSDTGAYIVMQYVEGTTLTKKILEEELSLSTKLNLLVQVAEGLAFAHKRGIIHRDIKSENILVSKYGEAKIADFGLAKINDEFSSQLTSHGQIMGTPDYMPPEIAKGGLADARSDQYSMGILFYFTLTRKLPFKASNIPSLLMKHIHEVPPPPRKLNLDINPSLNYIVVRMLQKEPELRYPSLDELLQDLKWVMMGQELPPEKIQSLDSEEEQIKHLEASVKPTKKLPTLLAKSIAAKKEPLTDNPTPATQPKPSSPQLKPSLQVKPTPVPKLTPIPKDKNEESNKNLPPQKPLTTSNAPVLNLVSVTSGTSRQKMTTANPTRKNVKSSGLRNAVASPQGHRKGSGKKQKSDLPLYLGIGGVLILLVIVGVFLKSSKKPITDKTENNNTHQTDPSKDPKTDPEKLTEREKQAAQLVGATLGLLVNETNYKFKKKQYEALLEKVANTSQVVKVEIALAKLKEIHEEEAKKIFEKAKKESDKLIEQASARKEWDINTETKMNNAEKAFVALTTEYEDTDYWKLKEQELEHIRETRKKLEKITHNPDTRGEPPALEGIFFEENGEKNGKYYLLEGNWKVIDGLVVGETNIAAARAFLQLGIRKHQEFQLQFEIKLDHGLTKVCLLSNSVNKEHHHFSSYFFKLKMGEWYPIKIEFRNNKFLIEANGQQDEVDASAGNFSTHGGIMFECDRNTLVYFRNVQLKDLK